MTAAGISGFGVGAKTSLAFLVTEVDQRAFAELSGDTNPMHLDIARAAELGYQAPVVYGGLLVAKLSQIVGLHFPGPSGLWSSLQVDFHLPLFVGEQATLEAEIVQISESTKSLVFRFVVFASDRVIAKGRVLGTLFATTVFT